MWNIYENQEMEKETERQREKKGDLVKWAMLTK